MCYVLITEHMTAEQQDELDAKLAATDETNERTRRAAVAAVMGGDVRGRSGQ